MKNILIAHSLVGFVSETLFSIRQLHKELKKIPDVFPYTPYLNQFNKEFFNRTKVTEQQEFEFFSCEVNDITFDQFQECWLYGNRFTPGLKILVSHGLDSNLAMIPKSPQIEYYWKHIY